MFELFGNALLVTERKSGETRQFEWPSATVGIDGKNIEAEHPLGRPVRIGKSLRQSFVGGELEFTVTLEPGNGPWWKKRVEISAGRALPTPDYVEVDKQELDDTLELCGYRATTLPRSAQRGEEEGIGKMPGCGYPLIGKKYFVGLEHPAGFCLPEGTPTGTAFRLRHYPQWHDRQLETVDAVLGWSTDPRASFFDYLAAIRLPPLQKPLVAFCTFWSDPYLGDYEYDVDLDNYLAFIRAFARMKLIPDLFTLDGGWNDRQSVFQAKPAVGGDKGLRKIASAAEALGAKLSLWVSHNGPVGICSEYLRRSGIAVGGGNGAAYCGIRNFGIMMDETLKTMLEKRFAELVGKLGAAHLKIDWDNECATNAEMSGQYPTANHVRQAALNAMFAIDRAMRRQNPTVVTRNGWWPSPWWLSHANHLWLSDSGDSEYASLPAKTQRDGSTTHRDIMYYNILRRDKSPLPLDCFDNHEFPDAPRNPFAEEPISWTNALWLSFLRGSTYLAYTLQPEKLEDWQTESFRRIMEFCNRHAEHLFSAGGTMILGNPNLGEIYGFLQPGRHESWCVIRNPLPIPQRIKFDGREIVQHPVKTVVRFYPHYEFSSADSVITLPAHGVAIMILTGRTIKPVFRHPHMAEKQGKKYVYRFPASLAVNGKVRPFTGLLQQEPELKTVITGKETTANTIAIDFSVRAPYRLREFELQLHIKCPKPEKVRLELFSSRYPGAAGSCFAVPLTEIPWNRPGYGEAKNQWPGLDRDRKFFAARIPDGGQFFYHLQISGADVSRTKVEMWVAGYEAPSRQEIIMDRPPYEFKQILPYQLQQGFIRLSEIVV